MGLFIDAFLAWLSQVWELGLKFRVHTWAHTLLQALLQVHTLLQALIQAQEGSTDNVHYFDIIHEGQSDSLAPNISIGNTRSAA
jgi:hypothetical protein